MPADDLPFRDQTHINEVRDALWKRPNPRASVMVGSGFSRNAEKVNPSAPLPPLWHDIAQEMLNELGEDHGLSVNDPLRLAQVYEANRGRDSLHDLLVRLIRDDDFLPGEAHSRLLALPWRDVFTTNWDTLLERARSNVLGRTYGVVERAEQLPEMSQPRIVKLHGSLPSTFPLIVTEEDYRTYPRDYEPFVNTVQQALIETVILLVGFSGSDPNFRQWAGWVRDQLRDSAPKVYLAGLLELSTEERAYLEDLNITPINLSAHPNVQNWPEDQRHEYATEWLLYTLEEGGRSYDQTAWPSPQDMDEIPILQHLRPIEYNTFGIPVDYPHIETTTSSPDYNNEPLEKVRRVIEAWGHNRRLYPGWLVFPSGQGRVELKRRSRSWEPHILKALPELGAVERLNAVREMLWIKGVLLEPMTPELEVAAQDVLEEIDCETRTVQVSDETPEDWDNIGEAWRTIAFALVTDARFSCDQALFERRLESLRPFSNEAPEVSHFIRQEHCLWSLYALELDSLSELLDEWEVEDSDPVWMLRKAALLTEIQRYEDSGLLIQMALDSIRGDSEGADRIQAASKEGWAIGSTLSKNTRRWVFSRWDELASLKCHAGDEVNGIQRELEGTVRQKSGPSYDLVMSPTTDVQWSGEAYASVAAAYRAVRLPEFAGLPPVNPPDSDSPIPHSVTSQILKFAAGALVTANPELAMRLVLRVCTYEKDDTLQSVMSRTRVATLPDDILTRIADACINVINYSLPRVMTSDGAWVNIESVQRSRVAMEVLSRLVLRLAPERVNAVLDIGLECYRTVPRHIWLGLAIGSLLRRTWEALPKDYRTSRVLDLMAAPIAGLQDFRADTSCPDPGDLITDDDFPRERLPSTEDQYREIFDLVSCGLRGGEIARSRAITRLLRLSLSEGLTEEEIATVADILWRNSDPVCDNPSGPGSALDWVYLILPQLEQGQAERSFRRKWLRSGPESQDAVSTLTADMFEQVGAAISGLRNHGCSFELSVQDEQEIATSIKEFVDEFCSGPVSFNLGVASQIGHLGMLALETTIPEPIARELFRRVEFLVESRSISPGSFDAPLRDVRIAIGYRLLPGLIKAMPHNEELAVNLLRVGLASDDHSRVRNAMSALRDWVSASAEGNMPPVPSALFSDIEIIIASRRRVGLAEALWCATWIFDRGTQAYRDTISSMVLMGLRRLAQETQYGDYPLDEDIPTIRALCVQLASTMAKYDFEEDPTIRSWVEIGRNDPFPEVRNMAAHSD